MDILFPIVNKVTSPVKSVNIDDGFSQFNRVFMFYASLTFAVTITIRQLIVGGPVISCDGFSAGSEEWLRFAEDWCWSNGMYTIKEAYGMSNRVSPYPGLIPEDMPTCIEFELYSGGRVECPQEHEVKPLTRIRHTWYPFTMFYFWMLSVMFHIPYRLYKHWGFDQVKMVVSMLQNPVEDGFEKREMIKRGSIWLYLNSPEALSYHSSYSLFMVRNGLALTELAVKILYLGNVIFIFYLTAFMFKIGSFFEYGLLWETDSMLNNVRSVIQEKLFPKVVACEVKRYGTTGLEEDQGMCMLSLNVVNQYVFLMFWFLLIISLIVNSIAVLMAILKIIFPSMMLRRFLVNASLEKSPAVESFSRLYQTRGPSLRFIMDIFAYNIQPKLLAEVLIQLYALLADRLPSQVIHDAVNSNFPGYTSLPTDEEDPPLLISNGENSKIAQAFKRAFGRGNPGKCDRKKGEGEGTEMRRMVPPVLLLNGQIVD